MSYKAGFIGLVGLPNVGKSSFFNRIIGENLSGVSPKPQTTRHRRTGIVPLSDNVQGIFLDAPGFLDRVPSKNLLMQFIAEEAQAVSNDCDIILWLVSSQDIPNKKMKELFELLRKKKKPLAVVVTKSDLKVIPQVLSWLDEIRAENIPVFYVSSKKNKGPDWNLLIQFLTQSLPDSPGPLYPEDQSTTESMREVAAELIREKCFLKLGQELPYGITVIIEVFDESPRVPRIEANIIVEKENHKAIVIGRGGQQLKAIGTLARESIEKIYGQKIFLALRVSVDEQWTQKARAVKAKGYERKH